jgi:hypothetical protein
MKKIIDRIINPCKEKNKKPIAIHKRKLYSEILEAFPTYYITLISIVQVTAFTYLIVMIQQKFIISTEFWMANITFLFLTLATFLVLIEVWYEYMMGSVAMRWIPKIWDAILPFFLGVAELVMILNLNEGNISGWYLAMGMVCFCSFLALVNMYRGCYYHYDENEILLASIGNYPHFTLIWIFAAGIIFSVIGYIEKINNFNSPIFALYSFLIISLFIIRGHFYWKKIIS